MYVRSCNILFVMFDVITTVMMESEVFWNVVLCQLENSYRYFNILLTVHHNIIIVFFTNLMHKFFILIHLLHSCTCFEPSGGQTVLVHPLVSSLSLGDCSVHRLTCVLNSHLKRVTIPEAVLIQFDLLRMRIIVLETCRGM